MGGDGREQDGILERTERGSGGAATAACATNTMWSTPDLVCPRAHRAYCCHSMIGLQVLPSLSLTLSLSEILDVSVVDNRVVNQYLARSKTWATAISV